MSKRRKVSNEDLRPTKYSKPGFTSIIIILDKNNSDKKWKYLLKNYNFEFYDHLYPFRLATSTIFKMTGVNDRIPFDEFAREHGDLACNLFGTYFAYDSFFKWFNFKPRKEIVVVTGFTEGVPAYDYAIDTLLQQGASVMYSPKNVQDEERFLQDFRECSSVPFHHGHPKNNMKKKLYNK